MDDFKPARTSKTGKLDDFEDLRLKIVQLLKGGVQFVWTFLGAMPYRLRNSRLK